MKFRTSNNSATRSIKPNQICGVDSVCSVRARSCYYRVRQWARALQPSVSRETLRFGKWIDTTVTQVSSQLKVLVSFLFLCRFVMWEEAVSETTIIRAIKWSKNIELWYLSITIYWIQWNRLYRGVYKCMVFVLILLPTESFCSTLLYSRVRV